MKAYFGALLRFIFMSVCDIYSAFINLYDAAKTSIFAQLADVNTDKDDIKFVGAHLQVSDDDHHTVECSHIMRHFLLFDTKSTYTFGTLLKKLELSAKFLIIISRQKGHLYVSKIHLIDEREIISGEDLLFNSLELNEVPRNLITFGGAPKLS